MKPPKKPHRKKITVKPRAPVWINGILVSVSRRVTLTIAGAQEIVPAGEKLAKGAK